MCSSSLWTFKVWEQTRSGLKWLYQNHVRCGYLVLGAKPFILQIYSCYTAVLSSGDMT